MRKVDHVKKQWAPFLCKSVYHALAYKIRTEFPRIGERFSFLCAEMILEFIKQHIEPRENLTPGQVFWMAYSLEDPPARNKRTADTHMIPVILDLSTSEDVQAILDRKPRNEITRTKAIRLCQQAYEQKGLLSNSDLAQLLNRHETDIGRFLSQYEDQSSEIVPRRATLHDMGTGLTHKRIICLKRYSEGKESAQIARETYHSIEAVDRYLGQFDRVRHCKLEGMTPEKIAFTLSCSLSLVHEYLEIDAILESKN